MYQTISCLPFRLEADRPHTDRKPSVAPGSRANFADQPCSICHWQHGRGMHQPLRCRVSQLPCPVWPHEKAKCEAKSSTKHNDRWPAVFEMITQTLNNSSQQFLKTAKIGTLESSDLFWLSHEYLTHYLSSVVLQESVLQSVRTSLGSLYTLRLPLPVKIPKPERYKQLLLLLSWCVCVCAKASQSLRNDPSVHLVEGCLGVSFNLEHQPKISECRTTQCILKTIFQTNPNRINMD